MKKRRAYDGVGFLAYERSRTYARGVAELSPMTLLAVLSILILVAVAWWKFDQTPFSGVSASYIAPVASSSPAAPSAPTEPAPLPAFIPASTTPATSSDPVSYLGTALMQNITGAYAALQQQNAYTPQAGQDIAKSLAPLVQAPVPYQKFSASDIRTEASTSSASAARYRTALQDALQPLMQLTQPELEIFGYYVQTKDPSYLDTLRSYAATYRAVASTTAVLVVPQDAVSVELGIVNSMGEMGAVLNELAAHADDPFASVALLRSVNQAQSDMTTSFNALYAYFRTKQAP